MRWKLIFLLSVFGILMGLATVYFIPDRLEHYVWVAIFIFCGFIISKFSRNKFFLNGFLLGVMDAVFTIGIRSVLYGHYLQLNPDVEIKNMQFAAQHITPQMMQLFTLPVVALGIGIVQGLFALVFSKFMQPRVDDSSI